MPKKRLSEEQRLEIKAFSEWLKNNRYPDSTIKTYSSIISSLPPVLNEENIIAFLQKRKEIYHSLPAIKQYCKYKGVEINWDIVKKEIGRWRQQERKEEVKHLSLDEIKILSEALEYPYNWIVKIQFELGCRIREVLNLRKENISEDLVDKMIKVTLREKGRKIRTVYITTKTVADFLRQFLSKKGYIFYPEIERTEENVRAIYTQVNTKIQKTAEKVLGKHISTHWFRGSRIILLFEEGYDLRTIQRFTGHSSLNILEWYLKEAGIDSKAIAKKEQEKRQIEW